MVVLVVLILSGTLEGGVGFRVVKFWNEKGQARQLGPNRDLKSDQATCSLHQFRTRYPPHGQHI